MTAELRTTMPFDEVVELARLELAGQGFSVATEIDMQATFRARLGCDSEPYLILGACNAALAWTALRHDPCIGNFLPCNVVIRQEGPATIVHTVDPEAFVSHNPDHPLQPLIEEAATRLHTFLIEMNRQIAA